MKIEKFFDARTFTFSYVVWSETTLDAVVIDPVLDYEPIGSLVFTESLDRLMDYLEVNQLALRYILETHAHADHLSASQGLKERYPDAQIAISTHITDVQEVFRDVFDLGDKFATDGSQFDLLFEDRATLVAGDLQIRTLPTPGHTPACTSFLIEDALFTGDSLLMPHVGTGRCDFPGASAATMYESITEEIYVLPDSTRIFVGHDYPPEGSAEACESTVAEQKQSNRLLSGQTTREQYIAARGKKDDTLRATRLLYQSIQVNIEAGHLPEPAKGGQRYLKIPLNVVPSERQKSKAPAPKVA